MKQLKLLEAVNILIELQPFYSNLKILKLEDLVLFEKAAFVFKSKTNSLPTQLDNYLKEITQVYKNVQDQVTNTNILFLILKLLKYRSRLNTKAHLYRML